MNMIRQYILSREVFFNLLIFLMWGYMLLAYYRGFVGMVPVIGNHQDVAEVALVSVIVLLGLPAMLNRMSPSDWLFLSGCTCVYVLNLGLFPDNYDVLLKNMFPTLCLVAPFFLMGRTLDIDKYLRPMLTISTLCILLDAFYFLIYMRNPAKMAERMAGEYYMYQAYRLLPHVMLILWRGMREFSLSKLFLALMGTFLILAYGTRGPLACLGIFGIVYFFAFTRFRHSMWVKGGMAFMGGLAVVFSRPLLILAKDSLEAVNMSTRIIERMLAGGLTHDTGRGFIKLKLYEYLERPDTFLGYGLFGCSRFGMKYPHDFALDFLFSFGYAIGSMLLILIAYIVIRAFVKTQTRNERELILMFLCMTVLKMFFSSSFIMEPFFFALLGYCVTIIIRDNHVTQHSDSLRSI